MRLERIFIEKKGLPREKPVLHPASSWLTHYGHQLAIELLRCWFSNWSPHTSSSSSTWEIVRTEHSQAPSIPTDSVGSNNLYHKSSMWFWEPLCKINKLFASPLETAVRLHLDFLLGPRGHRTGQSGKSCKCSQRVKGLFFFWFLCF